MIILDFHSKTPIYEQIEEQVMLMVRRGVYKPHDRLPSTAPSLPSSSSM